MQTKPLSKRQLFTMKPKSLAKRVQDSYQETQNTAFIIECLVAIMVRQALCREEFTQPLIPLIRELFLTKAADPTMRRFSPFFEVFFDESEWRSIIARIFNQQQEYHAAAKAVEKINVYLTEKRERHDTNTVSVFNLTSVFKDAKGKRHTWTLRDVDASRSENDTAALLKVLTSLTILETNGTRQFAEYVRCKRFETSVDMVHEEAQEEVVAEVQAEAPKAPSQKLAVTKKRPVTHGEMLPQQAMTEDKATAATAVAVEEEYVDQETYELAEAAVAAIARGKKKTVDFRKPKSEKQKEQENKEMLLRRQKTNSGKRSSKTSGKRKKKRK